MRSPACQVRTDAPADKAAGDKYACNGFPVFRAAPAGRTVARQVTSHPSRFVTPTAIGPHGSVSRNSPRSAGYGHCPAVSGPMTSHPTSVRAAYPLGSIAHLPDSVPAAIAVTCRICASVSPLLPPLTACHARRSSSGCKAG